MASNRVREIADNYEYYTALLTERKSIFSEVIEINEVGNNANTLEQQEIVHHPITQDNLFLIVNVKIKDHNFFQFKLKYKEFCPRPFFRFDSDGEAHRNKIDGIPLSEQLVTTPHFHKFHQSGIEVAYKSEKLLNPIAAKALQDINHCIAHFLDEANIVLNENDYPEIKILSNTLGLTLTSADPNANINFV